MASSPDGGLEQVRNQLLPLLASLCEAALEDRAADQHRLFARIRAGVEGARDLDDLAGPFMELSTVAFLGHVYSPAITLLLDRVLAIAQGVSLTLSASGDAGH